LVNECQPEWLLKIQEDHKKILISYDTKINTLHEQVDKLKKELKSVNSNLKVLVDEKREKKLELDEEVNEMMRQWLNNQ
jgi:uncharacterized coiled-coil DUF342 family protein